MNVLNKHMERIELIKSSYGFNLTDKQREVFECKDRQASFIFNRGEGCTTIACIKALDFAIKNPGSRVAIYEPVRAISIHAITTLRNIIRQCSNIINPLRSRRSNMFELNNGSFIIIESNNHESIRGRKNDFAIIDGVNMFDQDSLSCIECTTISSSIGQTIMLIQNDAFMMNL